MMIKLIISLLLTLCMVCSCTISKVTPILDSEFAPQIASELSGVHITTENTLTAYEKDRLHPIIETILTLQANEDSKREPQTDRIIITLSGLKEKYSPYGKGFQCFEPYVYVVTLGIIPAICQQEYVLQVTMIDPITQTQETKSISYHETQLAGWIALPIALSSTWNHTDGETHLRNAFMTILNNSQLMNTRAQAPNDETIP